MNFKFPAVLRSVMKCHAVPARPTQHVSHPVVRRVRAVPAPAAQVDSDWGSRHGATVLVFTSPCLPTVAPSSSQSPAPAYRSTRSVLLLIIHLLRCLLYQLHCSTGVYE